MSSGLQVDFSQLQAAGKRLEEAIAQKQGEALMEKVILELANRFLGAVKQKTPVINGNLRNNWFIGDVGREGNNFVVEIYNNVDYAPMVEYGHKQTVGRYVPAIGKRLVKPWVKGRFMMTLTKKEIEALAPKLLGQRTDAFLKELMAND